MDRFSFHEIARLPEGRSAANGDAAYGGDNAAIAVRRLEAGAWVTGAYEDAPQAAFQLSHTVLEGHRFAVRPIRRGEPLLSWGLPFGIALRDIQPGDYLADAAVLEALQARFVDFDPPTEPNFADRALAYRLDEESFRPADALPGVQDGLTFLGYPRPGGRGSGTRSRVVLLGLSSYTNGYVRRLEERLKDAVALTHTEGSRPGANNRLQVLRALAGFCVHPNTAAALIVEQPGDALTWEALRSWMEEQGYPLAHVPHAHLPLSGDFEADLRLGEEMASGWLGQAGAERRVPCPLSELKIALQCGGSDAFSGISGNPLVAAAARELIRRGGSALLAETPELMGAEAYVLAQVRSLEVARRFLAVQERFREQVGQFGVSVEGNISGGNRYRGLYNITLKSIGAARKRPTDVRLDGVLDYAERLEAPGYYFMDTPGNDLESIAGQVAAGCNLILFVTGNGSLTNFPFVPTIKVVTTSGRYNLLPEEMDVNAGRYLDGVPMAALAEELFDLMRAVADGQRTAGEKAGHSQAQLWRAAPVLRTEESDRPADLVRRRDSGLVSSGNLRIAVDLYQTPWGYAQEQVGLVLPASLCSAQVARLAAAHLNQARIGQEAGISRFVALPHSEGCGASGGTNELLIKTLAGYLRSPLTACGVVLEHGCEQTLNDVIRQGFIELGLDPQTIGWASAQMDGGLRKALAKMDAWFRDWAAGKQPLQKRRAGMEALRLGLLAHGELSKQAAQALSVLADAVAAGGGTVVAALPLPGAVPLQDLAEMPGPGLYRSCVHSDHWTEALSGLGAAGLNVMLGVTDAPLPAHPLVPVVQAAEGAGPGRDLPLAGDPAGWPEQMLAKIASVLAGEYVPLALQQGNIDFQLSRGETGVSL